MGLLVNATEKEIELNRIDEAYGSSPGSKNWNPDADLNGDGIINVFDMALASKDPTSEIIYTPQQASSTIMSVDPENTVVLFGEDFSININVTDADFTWAFEFKLGWDAFLINVTDVTNGSFLSQGGEVYCVNDTHYDDGWLMFSCSLLEPATSKSGNGDLAIINFTTLNEGDTTLHLYDTYLLNDTLDNYTHETNDGSVSVVECLNDWDCPLCEECSPLNTCDFAPSGTDPKGDCIGNCDVCNGAGSCTKDQSLCTGDCDYCTGSGNEFNCAANETVCELMYCGDCKKDTETSYNCKYDATEDEDCPTCQECAALDTCSNVPEGGDPKEECPADACKYGYCDGAGACKYYPDTTDCGICALCNGFGSCNVYDETQDEDCGFCEECSSLKHCDYVPFGSNPKGDCLGNCGVCNGAGSCTKDQSLCIGNCDYCTGSDITYNCAANETVCELKYCADCTGSGNNYNCVYDQTEDEDCDPFDFVGIATCTNDPDAYDFTWDYRAAFDSVCAGLDQCTQGDSTITHTCADNNLTDTVPLGGCNAECDENSDCVCEVCFSNCTCLILVGDVNDNREVDILDLVKLGIAYGSTPSDPRWDPDCDIYGPGKVPDGIINIFDLALIGKNYGNTC